MSKSKLCMSIDVQFIFCCCKFWCVYCQKHAKDLSNIHIGICDQQLHGKGGGMAKCTWHYGAMVDVHVLSLATQSPHGICSFWAQWRQCEFPGSFIIMVYRVKCIDNRLHYIYIATSASYIHSIGDRNMTMLFVFFKGRRQHSKEVVQVLAFPWHPQDPIMGNNLKCLKTLFSPVHFLWLHGIM
jgi:hypothetical protein